MALVPSKDKDKDNKDKDKQVVKKKRQGNSKVWFWANECKYEVILENVQKMKWKLIHDEKYEPKSNIYWIDVATIHERFRTILPWQIINHFPGMPNIARKNRMGQNLNRMLKLFPREYSYYPRTWVLPGELNDFRAQFDNQGNSIGNKIYIIKPDTGCQGRGIFLTRTFDTVPQHENVVAQLYIKKPLLIDGFKFDLRIYCLVSSVKPLRMYLFHDGLVRMCTEEYTKPTKQNLSMVCMHLTNYAVNKHNSNFQQPNAKSSDDAQDEGSKRSLHWFMNFIKDEHGEAKANWLWKRIGTLCVRTVLSIMPTLSREYDQHFKSFGNIPNKSPNKLYGNAGSGSSSSSSSNNNNPSGNPDNKRARGESMGEDDEKDKEKDGDGAIANSNNEDEDDDDNEDEDDEDDEDDYIEDIVNGNASDNCGPSNILDPGASSADAGAENGGSDSATANGKKKRRKIQFRGSRCFEILGYDIMIDSSLKPWLIEVNHLPSFGTDSPLDQDIKERLMQQVLSVLSVKPDDEYAYNAYHKAEANRRLHAKREADKISELAQQAQAAPKAKPRRPLNAIPSGGNGALSSKSNASESSAQSGASDNKTSILESIELAEITDDENEDEDLDAEVTPERLLEIKAELVVIYEEHSPEKIPKIERLLAKYAGREEEFLRFVHLKYGLPPPITPKQRERQQRRLAREQQRRELLLRQQQEAELQEQASSIQQAEDSNGESNQNGESGDENELTADNSNANQKSDQDANKMRGSVGGAGREPNRKQRVVSRSLSPTPAGSRRAAWKGSSEDDAAYRNEVMSQHIPQENDEWMMREMKRLVQFTRIFPLQSYYDRLNGKKVGEGEEDNDKEDDGDEDADDENNEINAKASSSNTEATAVVASSKSSSPPVKSATYEEILFQVFLQDKRQTMRLRCPLPSRAKSGPGSDTASLPPLESRSSSSSSTKSAFSTSGKGVVGWKAPPKQERKEIVKVVTQTQLESAKRLSQGLSVAQINQNARNRQGPQIVSNPAAVLIMDEYDSNIPTNQQQLSGVNGMGTSVWMNARFQNVRQNQMLQRNGQRGQQIFSGRGGYASATPASVLRQQVFHFGSDTISTANGINGNVGEFSVGSMGSVAGNPSSVLMQMQNGQINMGESSSNQINSSLSLAGSSVIGRTMSGGPSGGTAGNGPRGQYQHQQQTITRTSENEEMLRQLFPGWF